MNKHIKIVNEGGSFFGHLIDGDQIIYRTPACPTANAASKLISEHLVSLSTEVKQPMTVRQMELSEMPVIQNATPITTTTSQTTNTASRSGGCGCRR